MFYSFLSRKIVMRDAQTIDARLTLIEESVEENEKRVGEVQKKTGFDEQAVESG